MTSILSHIAHFIHAPVAAGTAGASDGVAKNLMELAEAEAGRNPHGAQELRSAACAYLSVVR